LQKQYEASHENQTFQNDNSKYHKYKGSIQLTAVSNDLKLQPGELHFSDNEIVADYTSNKSNNDEDSLNISNKRISSINKKIDSILNSSGTIDEYNKNNSISDGNYF